jgi:hypothetical protein
MSECIRFGAVRSSQQNKVLGVRNERVLRNLKRWIISHSYLPHAHTRPIYNGSNKTKQRTKSASSYRPYSTFPVVQKSRKHTTSIAPEQARTIHVKNSGGRCSSCKDCTPGLAVCGTVASAVAALLDGSCGCCCCCCAVAATVLDLFLTCAAMVFGWELLLGCSL